MKGFSSNLNDRKLKVLAAIVELYIDSGEPVGSKAVVDRLDKSVSSATIRNDMTELTQLGMIEQPHTSAGRVPSQAGYRLYIDNLMHKYTLTEQDKAVIDDMLKVNDSPEAFLENTSAALACLTNMAAMSTTPVALSATVTKIELLPMGSRSAVIVLLTSNGIMKSRLFRLNSPLTGDLINRFGQLVTKSIIGQKVSSITLPYIQTLAASTGDVAFDMIPILLSVYETAKEAGESGLCLKGQANLLIHPEYGGVRARELLEFLSQRELMMSVLRKHKGGVSVILGSESSQQALDGSSMLVTQYRIGEHEAGTIGILGPDRMDYSRLIPSIEYFALRVGKILSEILGERDDANINFT